MSSDLRITAVPAGQLSDAQIRRWSELQLADPAVNSPYFRPEFTLAVADVCEGVEVAVFEQGGETVGFLPFQRVRGKRGVPVGQMTSNFQGAVTAPGIKFDVPHLLKSCRLVAWDFDHLLAAQPQFSGYGTLYDDSPFMNLSEGFDAYLAQQRAAHKSFFDRIRRQARALARDLGPLRLECPVDDPIAFDTLIAWKREQYRRTKIGDSFLLPWKRPLLERIAAVNTPHFSGCFGALYAGDQLVSAHFGMRSDAVLHYWFPAYDASLPSRYSPGHTLMLEMAAWAAGAGIQRMDLGKGDEPYKQHFASGNIAIMEGSVDLRLLPRIAKNGWIRTREHIRRSRLRIPARAAKRLMRPLYDRLMYGAKTVGGVSVSESHRSRSIVTAAAAKEGAS